LDSALSKACSPIHSFVPHTPGPTQDSSPRPPPKKLHPKERTRVKDVPVLPVLPSVLAGTLNPVPLIRAQRVRQVVRDGLAVAHDQQQLAVFQDEGVAEGACRGGVMVVSG